MKTVKIIFRCLLCLFPIVWDSCSSDSYDELVEKLPLQTAFQSNLPVMIINTPEGCQINSKKEWINNTNVSLISPEGSELLNTITSIKGRGNITWEKYPKKPYSLKFDKRVDMLGMKPAKKWVLLANWADRTLLRNDVAFEISRRTSLEWTPCGTHIELILNGEYQGSYYLCEKIQVDKNRLNIIKMTEEDQAGENITGGYLMEIDDHYDEENKFKSMIYHLPYQFHHPDDDIISKSQFDYMENYIGKMEASLNNTSMLLSNDYKQWIDPLSFVDWWIVNELCYNKETGRPRSVFVYKQRSEKIKMGPVWDFDFRTFTLFDEIYVAKNFPYLKRLFLSPDFQQLAKKRWKELRPVLADITNYIDEKADLIRISSSNNIRRWPITSKGNNDESLTFEEAVDQMKKSIELRMAVIDNYLR